MIDFAATKKAISDYRQTIALDMSSDDQTSAIMERVCVETPNFSEQDSDAYSRSFINWCKRKGLLRLAA